ncbi:excinuclease ABC subunit A [uncultured Shimia sp.]|uniref:excinuclease ABC subunit A n=1 Tax=uncultured Shimia sp. TaxID=573152 RepID=UPI00261516A7|nr:excinuclease ABC subunit A [uncultured Shimia sp.]
MTQDRAIYLLKLTSLGTVLFGLIPLFAMIGGLHGVVGWFMDLTHLPLDGAQSFGGDSEKVLAAIGGGLMVSLGVVTWQVTIHVYANDPETGASIISWGVWSWYVVDSAGSLVAGAWFNVVMNTGFLLMFVLPITLAKPRQAVAA